MKKQLKQVEEFQKMSNDNLLREFGALPIKQAQLRYELMKEENEEYLHACMENNLIEIADALGDQLYILLGTINNHGLQHKIEEVFNRIHDNNMMKCPNGVCTFREDGKLLKPEGFKKVSLEDILVTDKAIFEWWNALNHNEQEALLKKYQLSRFAECVKTVYIKEVINKPNECYKGHGKCDYPGLCREEC